jgi:predicted SAM-dependent methyltransferase
MKIEFGSGERPTPGFMSSDVYEGSNATFIGNPWEIELPDNTVEKFLALGVMEHLRYQDFKKTLSFVIKKLKPEGDFMFDVPDMVIWAQYLVDIYSGKNCDFEEEHVWSTFYGWQRWPGDEHKSGWTLKKLDAEIKSHGFSRIEYGVKQFIDGGFERRRMTRLGDAHIYVKAIK